MNYPSNTAQTARFPKTALFVGAGAVENAWSPVIDAIRLHNGVVCDSDTATCFLAREVYKMRFFECDCSYGGAYASDFKTYFNQLKHTLCLQLQAAESRRDIRARKELRYVITNLVIPTSSLFYLVSTNWDTTVDKAAEEILADFSDSQSVKVFHLHGSSDQPETLYLPSEWSGEFYRDESEREAFGGNLRGLLERLDELEHLIVYGLSFSPLDAELTQLINAITNHEHLKSITVVDPDADIVEKRIKQALNNPRLSVIKLDPNTFSMS